MLDIERNLPALSISVPSLFCLKGAPPPPHNSYISGSHTHPSLLTSHSFTHSNNEHDHGTNTDTYI